MKSFLDFATLSEASLLIQLVVAVVYVTFTLLVAFLVSENEIKPKWFRYSIYAFLYLVMIAFFRSWDEKRIFAAWAENLVAEVFWYGGMGVGIACGYFIGMRVFKAYRYNKPVLAELIGWIVGIVIAIIIFLIIINMGEKLPGVGWRFDTFGE